jgi:hypothetical protein
MEFFSKTLQRNSTRTEYSLIANNVFVIEHEDPKQRFGHNLTTTRHERSDEFNTAIEDYYKMDLSEIGEPQLRALVHGCMVHGETAALLAILPLYENLDEKTLRIRGPIDTRGWETLATAMEQQPLLFEALELSHLQLDHDEGELLFKALSQMLALKSLHLEGVGVESSFRFSALKCPPLKLQTLMVSVGPGNVDVSPLLLKLLECCKLRNLRLLDDGEVILRHEEFGHALKGQVGLQSLQLACKLPKNFLACYMPFLEMPTPLKVLELSRCDVGIPLCNKLLEVLPRSKPELRSLSLTSCSLQPCEGPDGRLQISHLAHLSKLVELDLSYNTLGDETFAPLLYTLAAQEGINLQRLNLNGSPIGNSTAVAMRSLLMKHGTLIWVSVVTNGRRDDSFVLPFVEPFRAEKNSSVLRLDFNFFAGSGPLREELRDHLARNRRALEAAVARGMWHGVQLVLGGRFYSDLVNRVMDAAADFSFRDALTLSSFHPKAWAARHAAL